MEMPSIGKIQGFSMFEACVAYKTTFIRLDVLWLTDINDVKRVPYLVASRMCRKEVTNLDKIKV